MRSHCKEIHGISNSIPFEADISMKKLHHQSSGCIAVEWRAQQNARDAVESTASGATSTVQIASLSAARMKKKMEDPMLDWRVDQSIQKSSVFQHTTRVEGSSCSSAIEVSATGRFCAVCNPACHGTFTPLRDTLLWNVAALCTCSQPGCPGRLPVNVVFMERFAERK